MWSGDNIDGVRTCECIYCCLLTQGTRDRFSPSSSFLFFLLLYWSLVLSRLQCCESIFCLACFISLYLVHLWLSSVSIVSPWGQCLCEMLICRVRTIPVLGYRVLGDICMYWVVSVSGDIFFGRDTRCDIVVHWLVSGAVHMITISTARSGRRRQNTARGVGEWVTDNARRRR